MLLALPLACTSSVSPSAAPIPAPESQDLTDYGWFKLPTEPYRGQQDDIFFLTPELG